MCVCQYACTSMCIYIHVCVCMRACARTLTELVLVSMCGIYAGVCMYVYVSAFP